MSATLTHLELAAHHQAELGLARYHQAIHNTPVRPLVAPLSPCRTDLSIRNVNAEGDSVAERPFSIDGSALALYDLSFVVSPPADIAQSAATLPLDVNLVTETPSAQDERLIEVIIALSVLRREASGDIAEMLAFLLDNVEETVVAFAAEQLDDAEG